MRRKSSLSILESGFLEEAERPSEKCTIAEILSWTPDFVAEANGSVEAQE